MKVVFFWKSFPTPWSLIHWLAPLPWPQQFLLISNSLFTSFFFFDYLGPRKLSCKFAPYQYRLQFNILSSSLKIPKSSRCQRLAPYFMSSIQNSVYQDYLGERLSVIQWYHLGILETLLVKRRPNGPLTSLHNSQWT